MIRKLAMLSFLISLSACGKSNNNSEKSVKKVNPNVIYGDDNRKDLFQLSDLDWLAYAQSTVAIIDQKKVIDQGTHYELSSTEFGYTYGLCSDEPFFTQPISAFCSGFLIGPDIIATAGHCIRNEYNCEKARFVFNFSFQAQGDDPTLIKKEDVFECEEIIHTETNAVSGVDFALIRLNNKVTTYPPLPLQLENNINDKEELVVIGHPSGLPTKWADGASVRSNDEAAFFVANLDTYGGNSGSAVFNAHSKKVEGILVRGESDYKYNVDEQCRRSNKCDSEACRGEDVVRISSILDYIDLKELEPLPLQPKATLLTPPIVY